MRDQDAIEKTVYRVLAHQFRVKEDEIRPDWRLVEDLSADSQALTEFMIQLEETFDREVPDVPVSELLTVADVVSLVRTAVVEPPQELTEKLAGSS